MIPPGLERIVASAAHRREERGAHGDAKMRIDPLRSHEADALDALPWPTRRRRRFLTGQSPRLGLLAFEAALEAAGLSPAEIYAESLGRQLRDLPAERAAVRKERASFWDDLAAHQVIRASARLRRWLDRQRSTGSIRTRDLDVVTGALRVIERLPVDGGIDRTMLAADLFDGRPHALDADGAIERWARAMLAAMLGETVGLSPRATWAAVGVEVDPVSTTVLTIGLRPSGASRVEAALRAQHGRHVVLTYGQISGSQPASWDAATVHVCENPSIVRAAERELGERCPPLVCGSGWPTDAGRLLLRELRVAGATLRYHGDFDRTGIAIFRHLETEVGVLPWRFDSTAYRHAARANAQRDLPRVGRGAAAAVGDLEATLLEVGREIPEELVVDQLLEDLASLA